MTRKGPPPAVTRTRPPAVRATRDRADVSARGRDRHGCARLSAWTCGAIGPGSAGTSSPARLAGQPATAPSRAARRPSAGRAGTARRRAARPGRRRRRRRIWSTSTPTYGARSVLLTTSRSARSMPGPALAGHVAATGDVDHEDLRVDEGGGEGRGEVVAARLHEHEVQRRDVGLDQVLDGQQVGGDVVADRGVRAGAGLDRHDPRRRRARRRRGSSGRPRRCRCRW